MIECYIINHDKRHTILNTHPRPKSSDDKWVWTCGMSKSYCVREGYKIAQIMLESERNGMVISSTNYFYDDVVWKLKAPNKVKLFV